MPREMVRTGIATITTVRDKKIRVPYTVELDWDALIDELVTRAWNNKCKFALVRYGHMKVTVGSEAQAEYLEKDVEKHHA